MLTALSVCSSLSDCLSVCVCLLACSPFLEAIVLPVWRITRAPLQRLHVFGREVCYCHLPPRLCGAVVASLRGGFVCCTLSQAPVSLHIHTGVSSSGGCVAPAEPAHACAAHLHASTRQETQFLFQFSHAHAAGCLGVLCVHALEPPCFVTLPARVEF